MENKKINILAIDDNIDNLITIQALVSEAFPDSTISLATNGNEALKLANEINPDVILLDIVMPDMDGFEVCKKLKSDDKLSDIPVVFVTALKGDKESRIHGLEVGAEAFLSKPIDESELVAQIRAMVKIKTANMERKDINLRLTKLVDERTKELSTAHFATLNLLEDLKTQIDNRVKTEAALSASEALYHSILDASPDIIAVTDITGKVQMISPNGVGFVGYSSENEIIGRYLGEFLAPEDVNRAIKNIEGMSIGIFNGPEEYKIVHSSGKKIDVEINAEFVKDNDGNPTRIVFAIRDIIERKRSQEALRESEEKYRFMTENTSDVLWHMTPEFCFDYVSPSIERMQGFKPEELIGKSMFSLLTESSRQEISQEIDQITKKMKVGDFKPEMKFEYESICKDGTIIWVEVNVTIQLGSDEKRPMGFHGVTRDITVRKQTQEALRENEEKYRLITEKISDVVWLMDLSGKSLFVSQSVESFTGFTVDEYLNQSFNDRFTKHSAEIALREFKKELGNYVKSKDISLDSKRILTLDYKCKNGDIKTGELLITPYLDAENNLIGIHGVTRDITERTKTELALKESEEKFRQMTNLLPQIVFETDSFGTLTYVNNQAYNICGYSENDNMIGFNSINLYIPEDRERAVQNVKRKLSGSDSVDSEYTMIRKDGTTFPVLVYSNPIYKDGKPAGLRGIIVDISDRKQIEEKLSHVVRMYAVLGEVNQVVTRSHNRDELLHRICKVAIDFGKFRMAWVGAIDEEIQKVKPITFSGFEDGYLENIDIPANIQSPVKGPSAVAITTQKVAVCNDISTDPLMFPWRNEALKRGYNSIASVPIKCGAKIFGMFTFYASEKNFFTDEEIYLLNKIGEEISFALDAIEAEKQRDIAQQLLLASKEKYRELMENSPEGITIYVDGKVAYINKEALRLMRGTDKSEMLGKTIVDFIHPNNREIVLERMKLVAMAPLNAILPSVEEKYIRLDGTEVDVEIKVMPIIYDGKPAFQLSGHDITDRKMAELALAKSRTELKTIYDNAPVIMCVVDEERQIQFANKAFSDLTGFSEDIIGNGVLGGVINCIHSYDNPSGCGFGGNCYACNLRKALEETHKTGIGFTNIEYKTTLINGDDKKEIHLLGSTALIDANDSKNILLCLHDITDRKKAEEALQKSEILLRTFIDNSPFEIWARDTESVGILENKKLVDHYGSIIGVKPEVDGRVDSETVNRWQYVNNRVFSGEIVDEEFEFEVNGEIRNFQQIVFPIKINSQTIGIAGFNIDITERKLSEKALQETQEQLKKFAAHLQNVREEERSLLARDIHDDLGQILIAMKIDLGLLRNYVIKTTKTDNQLVLKSKFDDLQNLVDGTLKSARRIMTDLRPEVLDLLGFIETVNQHIKNFGLRNKIECNFINNTTGVELTSQQSVALFRIVQETLNNTAKHARATKVDIKLIQSTNHLTLEISDNGVGFDLNDKKKTDSYGLLGIKERVFLLGGELKISSIKNEGTTIKVIMKNEYIMIGNA